MGHLLPIACGALHSCVTILELPCWRVQLPTFTFFTLTALLRSVAWHTEPLIENDKNCNYDCDSQVYVVNTLRLLVKSP